MDIHQISLTILVLCARVTAAGYILHGDRQTECRRYCERSNCKFSYCSAQSLEHMCTCVDCEGSLPEGGMKSCMVYGDPVVFTFDGWPISTNPWARRKRWAEMVNAGYSYIMVKENAFSIIADTANCGEPSCLLMSITIMHESQIIKLGQSRRVSLDDVDERLPFEVHGINIALTPESHVLAELPDGFSVIWDGQHRAIVSAPSTHRTKGLCGNNDGNPDNDMQNPDGEMCDNVQDFIASWEVKPGLKSCTVYGDPYYTTFDRRSFASGGSRGRRKRWTEMEHTGLDLVSDC